MIYFSKERMLDRIENEGRNHLLNDEVLSIMDNLDDCRALPTWAGVVNGEPLYWVVGKNGEGAYVNVEDCYRK